MCEPKKYCYLKSCKLGKTFGLGMSYLSVVCGDLFIDLAAFNYLIK